jgi:hypothetical protein
MMLGELVGVSRKKARNRRKAARQKLMLRNGREQDVRREAVGVSMRTQKLAWRVVRKGGPFSKESRRLFSTVQGAQTFLQGAWDRKKLLKSIVWP